MEERFLQQLKKGVLEMLVLEAVCRKASYGYELMLEISGRSGGRLTLKEGTLYPILYRLEDEGLIESAWSSVQGRGAPKKVYTATDRGRAERQQRRETWTQFVATVELFFGEEAE